GEERGAVRADQGPNRRRCVPILLDDRDRCTRSAVARKRNFHGSWTWTSPRRCSPGQAVGQTAASLARTPPSAFPPQVFPRSSFLTVILRGWTSGRFGTCSVSTPCSRLALRSSTLAPSGRVNVREKE